MATVQGPGRECRNPAAGPGASSAHQRAPPVAGSEGDIEAALRADPTAGGGGEADGGRKRRAEADREPADQDEPLRADGQVHAREHRAERRGGLGHAVGGPGVVAPKGDRERLGRYGEGGMAQLGRKDRSTKALGLTARALFRAGDQPATRGDGPQMPASTAVARGSGRRRIDLKVANLAALAVRADERAAPHEHFVANARAHRDDAKVVVEPAQVAVSGGAHIVQDAHG